ncbi:hypothetical protein EDC48_104159 [Gibbsiella quercinecans]|nr:hypothetical protein EDC48_104159 [Gibbsiella quercinecans]
MARCFVFVDQAFSSLAIHKWLHYGECFLCCFFVASFDSGIDLLNEGTHH